MIAPSFVDDQDEIYPTMLGPTLKQLQEKAAEGTLDLGDIAGYLAVEKALAEMREETWLSIPFEAVPLIAEKLVEPAVWGKLEAEKAAEAKRPRDEKLQDLANARYPPEAKATDIGIAIDFWPRPRPIPIPLRSLLVLKNAAWDDKLMEDGLPSLVDRGCATSSASEANAANNFRRCGRAVRRGHENHSNYLGLRAHQETQQCFTANSGCVRSSSRRSRSARSTRW